MTISVISSGSLKSRIRNLFDILNSFNLPLVTEISHFFNVKHTLSEFKGLNYALNIKLTILTKFESILFGNVKYIHIGCIGSSQLFHTVKQSLYLLNSSLFLPLASLW